MLVPTRLMNFGHKSTDPIGWSQLTFWPHTLKHWYVWPFIGPQATSKSHHPPTFWPVPVADFQRVTQGVKYFSLILRLISMGTRPESEVLWIVTSLARTKTGRTNNAQSSNILDCIAHNATHRLGCHSGTPATLMESPTLTPTAN